MEIFVFLFVIIFGLWAFTGFATPGMIDEDGYVDHLHIFRGYHKHKEIKAELEAIHKANEIAALRKEIENLKNKKS